MWNFFWTGVVILVMLKDRSCYSLSKRTCRGMRVRGTWTEVNNIWIREAWAGEAQRGKCVTASALESNSSKIRGWPKVLQGEISTRSEHILFRSSSVHSSSTTAGIQTQCAGWETIFCCSAYEAGFTSLGRGLCCIWFLRNFVTWNCLQKWPLLYGSSKRLF